MLRIYYYIISIILLIASVSCSEDSDTTDRKSISIKLIQDKSFNTKLIDEDNPIDEQIIKNLSVFFTDPSSETITNKYIYSGFTSVDDYKLITLPLEPATIQTKDIYIVANYDDVSALDTASTIEELRILTTPKVDKTKNINPQDGFCMSGKTLNYDFNESTNTAAIVNLIRTCAKYRISVTFPQNPTLSTNNSFLIEGAAKYTYLEKSIGTILPLTEYYTYAEPIALVDNGSQEYVNSTYIYEAVQPPRLYIYTHIRGSVVSQEYSANLPLPVRNYLYDISIDIYEDTASHTKSSNEKRINYIYKTDIKVYDSDGVRVNLEDI